MLIYIIKNKVNSKVYIGQTIHTIDHRWKGYYREYKYKKNLGLRIIIKAMRKHGFDNFYYEILKDNITSIEELNYWEKYYIKKYKSTNKYYGYNIENGGNSKGKHSSIIKQKISKAQKGSKNHMYGRLGKDNPTSKRIIDLTTGKIFDSVMDICREYHYNNGEFSKICACARGDRWFTNHKTYRYLDANDIPIIVPLPKAISTNYVYYCVEDKSIYLTIKDIAKKHNLHPSYIAKCMKKNKSIQGNTYKKSEHKVTYEYYTKGRDYNNILPEFRYLINTVLSPPKIIGGKV